MSIKLLSTVTEIRRQKQEAKQKAARERWAKRVDNHRQTKELMNESR